MIVKESEKGVILALEERSTEVLRLRLSLSIEEQREDGGIVGVGRVNRMLVKTTNDDCVPTVPTKGRVGHNTSFAQVSPHLKWCRREKRTTKTKFFFLSCQRSLRVH